MNIYKVTLKPGEGGYDRYYGMIVVAPTANEARKIHPLASRGDMSKEEYDLWVEGHEDAYREECTWVKYADIDQLLVEDVGIGYDTPGKILLTDYNRG